MEVSLVGSAARGEFLGSARTAGAQRPRQFRASSKRGSHPTRERDLAKERRSVRHRTGARALPHARAQPEEFPMFSRRTFSFCAALLATVAAASLAARALVPQNPFAVKPGKEHELLSK